jgi:hypothetical protein
MPLPRRKLLAFVSDSGFAFLEQLLISSLSPNIYFRFDLSSVDFTA